MLTTEDCSWLGAEHPRLTFDGRAVAGEIAFMATFNRRTGRFQILSNGAADATGGLVLSGEFSIRIEERVHKRFSALPAVYVQDLEATSTRPIGRQDHHEDKSACLCSPFAEDEFLRPTFQFRFFLEELVIPFLYGQVFYSLKQEWPWSEYAHGASGLLEAYSDLRDRANMDYCLDLLRKDSAWKRVEEAFRQKPHVKGHAPCFCSKMDHIRRCHPRALQGIRKLQNDIMEKAREGACGLPPDSPFEGISTTHSNSPNNNH